MDDVLNDLGNRWQSLSKAQQVALAQTVGGVRQYTNLIALMDNFDFYQQNIDIAKNSEGTLQRQQAIYEKSWEASSKRVKAAAETIYSSLLNDKFFIKLNNGFAGLLDIIN
jgi:TP901 family phage tail tape measure protein